MFPRASDPFLLLLWGFLRVWDKLISFRKKDLVRLSVDF